MADRKQQQRKAAEVVHQIEKQVGLCFGLPAGQDALKHLKRLFYDRSSFVKGDPYHTAFKEGQRDVIGYIIECVDALEAASETS